MNKSRILKLVVVLLVGLVVVSGLVSYKHSFETLTMVPPTNSKVDIYYSKGSEDGVNIDRSAVLASISNTKTIKLKRGSYVYVVKPGSIDYQPQTDSFSLGDKPLIIRPRLTYTESKLESIAEQSRAEVLGVLQEQYPTAMKSYSLTKLSAYGDGSWLGGRLDPNNANQDSYIIVLRKIGNKIYVATNPPAIYLTQPVYPDIPRDIIDSANKLIPLPGAF